MLPMFTFLFPSVILNGAPQQCFLHSFLHREVKDAENLSFAMQDQGISTGGGYRFKQTARLQLQKVTSSQDDRSLEIQAAVCSSLTVVFGDSRRLGLGLIVISMSLFKAKRKSIRRSNEKIFNL